MGTRFGIVRLSLVALPPIGLLLVGGCDCTSPSPTGPGDASPRGLDGSVDSGPTSDSGSNDGGRSDSGADAGATNLDGGGPFDGGPDAGSCSSACTGATVCDPSLNACVTPCPCSAGFVCDSTTTPASCAPLLASCGGTTCAAGEACISGACQCIPTHFDPDAGVVNDSCFQYGYACDTTTGHCTIPGEADWCMAPGNGYGGCQAGLDCVSFTTISCGQNPLLGRRCARRCTSSQDCVFPRTPLCATQPQPGLPDLVGHCTWEPCDTQPVDGGLKTLLYAPCNGGRGTCFLETEPAFECGINEYLPGNPECESGGTALANGNCSPTATLGAAGNPSAVCASGQICVPLPDGTGYCSQGCIYNYGNPVPNDPAPCPSGALCLNATGVYFAPLYEQGGACLARCDLFGDGGCAPNASGRPFACGVNPVDPLSQLSTGSGVCVPEASNAPGQGGACTGSADAVRNPSPCANDTGCDDQFFNVASGQCRQYCDTAPCTQGPCPSDCPTGTNCIAILPADAGAITGMCF